MGVFCPGWWGPSWEVCGQRLLVSSVVFSQGMRVSGVVDSWANYDLLAQILHVFFFP